LKIGLSNQGRRIKYVIHHQDLGYQRTRIIIDAEPLERRRFRAPCDARERNMRESRVEWREVGTSCGGA